MSNYTELRASHAERATVARASTHFRKRELLDAVDAKDWKIVSRLAQELDKLRVEIEWNDSLVEALNKSIEREEVNAS
jgi:hypothetical protein